MARLNDWRWWGGAAGLIGLLLVPLGLASYPRYVLTLAIAYGIAALGLNVLKGYLGLVVLSHHAFFALGAYATGLLMLHMGMPFPIAVIVGAVATTVVGILLALPALRLSGFYLAIATLGFGALVERILVIAHKVTGGTGGLTVPSWSLQGIDKVLQNYYLALMLAVPVFFAARNIARSRIGRAWITIRDAEVAAEAMGISLPLYKTQGYALSSFFAALGGGMYAQLIGFISPEHFNMWLTINFISMIVVGGLGTISGVIIGALFFTWLPEVLQSFQKYQSLIFGLVLTLTIGFLPDGLVSLPAKLGRLLRKGSAPPQPTITPVEEQSIAIGPPSVRPTPVNLPHHVGNSVRHVITVSDVSVRFGGLQALDRVNLQVRAGEIFGLIGPNGAGKTVLFNCLTGFVPPASGRIEIGGRPVAGLKPWDIAALGVSRTFQTSQLAPRMTVLENVLVGTHRHLRANMLTGALWTPRVAEEERTARGQAMEVLELLKIAHVANQLAADLPIATRRLVEIARSLASRPWLLLLDEPAAGLNTAETAQLADTILQIRDQLGIGILLIEHELSLVMRVSQRIMVLNFGVCIAEGTPDAIRHNPEVIRAYVGGDLAAQA